MSSQIVSKNKRIFNDSQNIRKNDFPLCSEHSILLILSSCSFLLPSLVGFMNGLHLHAVISLITSLVSINYWRYAIPGIRKAADLVVAKVSFVIYFVTGLFHIRDVNIFIIGWILAFLIIGSYALSNHKWNKDSDHWIIFHLLFHIFVALAQATVLYGSFLL